MIAILERGCPLKQKAEIVRLVEGAGFRVQVSEHDDQSMVGVIGPGADQLADQLAAMPGVKEIRPVAPPLPASLSRATPRRHYGQSSPRDNRWT